MSTILQARGLAKTYLSDGVEVLALRGVDLGVEAGEFVAIMGPSGCGKSTLLHLLGGLDRPTAGSLALDGRSVDRLSEAAWAVLRRREIGFVFQFFNLVGNLTVAENVELPARLVGTSSADARLRRDERPDRRRQDGADEARIPEPRYAATTRRVRWESSRRRRRTSRASRRRTATCSRRS